MSPEHHERPVETIGRRLRRLRLRSEGREDDALELLERTDDLAAEPPAAGVGPRRART